MKMNRGGFHQPIYAQCHSASIFYKKNVNFSVFLQKYSFAKFEPCVSSKSMSPRKFSLKNLLFQMLPLPHFFKKYIYIYSTCILFIHVCSYKVCERLYKSTFVVHIVLLCPCSHRLRSLIPVCSRSLCRNTIFAVFKVNCWLLFNICYFFYNKNNLTLTPCPDIVNDHAQTHNFC